MADHVPIALEFIYILDTTTYLVKNWRYLCCYLFGLKHDYHHINITLESIGILVYIYGKPAAWLFLLSSPWNLHFCHCWIWLIRNFHCPLSRCLRSLYGIIMPAITYLPHVEAILYYFTPIVRPMHGGSYVCHPRIHSFKNNESALIITFSFPLCRNLSKWTCSGATDIHPIGTRPVRPERVTQIAFPRPLNGRKRPTEAVLVDCCW